MAWTWKGFWGDDPVYRFNCGNNFWHAGRSKAEERFWVDHVHGDGSYKTPLRCEDIPNIHLTFILYRVSEE